MSRRRRPRVRARRWSSEAVLQLDVRLPAEQLLGAGDVGLPHLRIVHGKRLEDDLARGAREPDDRLGELEQRLLVRVAEVDRKMLAGLCEQDDPANQVVHVAEAPRLRAVAEHRDRLPVERLAQKRRDGAAVVRPHPAAVGVEDPHDPGVDALLAVVRHHQRLGVALGLVVHPARADGVDVSPVRLGLRVHLRISVDLARRGEQEARALELREAERVVRPVGAGLERVQRHAQVVDRARERGEVVDVVDGLVDGDRVDHVVIHERERVVAQVLDVLERRDDEVVQADHPVAALEQRFAEVGAEEAGAAGDEGRGHGVDGSQRACGICYAVAGSAPALGPTTTRPRREATDSPAEAYGKYSRPEPGPAPELP